MGSCGDPRVEGIKLISRLQAPRGLSAEEKRVKLVEIFHETVSPRLFAFSIRHTLTEGRRPLAQKDFFQVHPHWIRCSAPNEHTDLSRS